MKIIAFLQNQWFKEPERIKYLYNKYPDKREEFNKRFLFISSKTGKVLKKAFGEELCNDIIWEESSKEIGSYSSSKFKVDLEHVREVINKHNPDVILLFGGIAEEIEKSLEIKAVKLPHPAARNMTNNEILSWKTRLLEELNNEFYN